MVAEVLLLRISVRYFSWKEVESDEEEASFLYNIHGNKHKATSYGSTSRETVPRRQSDFSKRQ